jgi:hypothetical protein
MVADQRIPAHQGLNLLEELAAALQEEFFELRVHLRSPEAGMENGDSSPAARRRNRIQKPGSAHRQERDRNAARLGIPTPSVEARGSTSRPNEEDERPKDRA